MIACPGCGFEAPDDFAFCPKCATALLPPLAIPEERKVVTTLFCDLVGFTALSEAADPEDVDAVLRAYHAAARKVIESHGGTVEKFIGDAVVGVFGVPAVHEDDPERAVRAGLRIVQALEGMARPDGDPLEARVGVNTGEALVRLDVTPGSGEGFLTGDAVNTAARLQAAAPPMGVAVGELTHELTRKVLVYEAVEPVAVKGKREPLEVWLAKTIGESSSRTGLRTSGKLDTPFLGRDAELRQLLAAFETAVATGGKRCVLVTGEPGIGKSRLVLELARALDERPGFITWRQGRCLAYGDVSGFAALSEILKAHAEILDSDDVATLEEKLEAVLPEGEDRPWLRQRLRPLLGLEASQAAQEENFSAWTCFLRHLVSSRPMVLVLEDLHWAGEGMLAFIELVASRGLEAPLLVVATTRPELLAKHPDALAPSERVSRLTLAPLSKKEASRLVSALLDEHLAAGLRAPILERIGGNPLYAEEYVRLLLDRNLLLKTRGALQLKEGEELPLPDSVQAVLAARLDTLPPAHKALLCDAAVFGETFWDGGVAALSGSNAGEVEEVMAALAERQLVRPAVSSSLADEVEYFFRHALARDVAYGELPRRARAQKHAAAAEWLAARAGARVEEFAEILAQHYATALDLARAAGDEDVASSLVAATIRWLARAGERALRLDVGAAERHFSRALELAGPSSRERLRLLPRWAEALFLRNRYRESVEAYEEAVTGLQASGDVRAAALAMHRQGEVVSFLGEAVRGPRPAAWDLLANDDPSPEQAEVFGGYAATLYMGQQGDLQSVIEAAARSIEVCERLALPEPALAMSFRGLARLDLGDLGGLEDYERALAVTRAQGRGTERAIIEYNYASFVAPLRGPRVALDAMGEVLEFARRCGLEAYVLACRAALIEPLRFMGEWDRALAEAADVVPALEENENVWDMLFLRSQEALIFACRGETGEAATSLVWLEEKGCGFGIDRYYVLLAASAVRLRLGESGAALGLLAEWVATLPAVTSLVEYVPEAVRVALVGGDGQLAARVVKKVESGLPARRLPLHQHVMATVGGLLAESRGEHEAGAAAYAAATSGWREFGVPYEEAQALLGRGRCLVALGRAPEAVPALKQAHEIFLRLGAKPALAEIDRVLDGTAATPLAAKRGAGEKRGAG